MVQGERNLKIFRCFSRQLLSYLERIIVNTRGTVSREFYLRCRSEGCYCIPFLPSFQSLYQLYFYHRVYKTRENLVDLIGREANMNVKSLGGCIRFGRNRGLFRALTS